MKSRLIDVVRRILSRLGLDVSSAPSCEQLEEVISMYRPFDFKGLPLIRLGSGNDGGYLVPDCIHEISECFSPGVDITADFEIDLSQRKIGSHLVDFSVEDVPAGFIPLSFTKKYIGPITEHEFVTLDDWMNEVSIYNDKNAMLQMDIEGAEYTAILCASEELLSRFKVIVLELHGLRELTNKRFFRQFADFSKKLTKNHSVVHLHPNNFTRPMHIRTVPIHTTLEVTLVRKDMVSEREKRASASYPHPLDSACVSDNVDAILSDYWYSEQVRD